MDLQVQLVFETEIGEAPVMGQANSRVQRQPWTMVRPYASRIQLNQVLQLLTMT